MLKFALVAVGTWHDNFTWQVLCHCSLVRNIPGKTAFVYTSWCVSLIALILWIWLLLN